MAKKRKKKDLTVQPKSPVVRFFPVIVFLALVLAMIALPTTILLLVGMFPTVVAFVVDKTKNRSRTISVAALNVAACLPFMMDLWTSGNSIGASSDIIADPVAIIVMYMGALGGYCVDWTLSGIASSFLYKKAQMRQKDIQKRQEELVERWGKEVTGEVPLTSEGYAAVER